MASPNVKLGCVVTRTASNQVTRARREHELGAIRRPHRMVTIFGVLRDLILRARRWKRLNVHRAQCPSLPRGIRHPAAVRRKHGAGQRGGRRLDRAKANGLSVFQRKHPERRRPALAGVVQEALAIRGPRFRNVRDSLVGLRQPLRRPGAVRALPEDAQVSLAIRLERDALAVRGPDGKPVVPLSFERHAVASSSSRTARRSRCWPPCRRRFRTRCACRRETCEAVGRRPAGFSAASESAFAIEQPDTQLTTRRRDGTRNVHQRPRVRDAELRAASGIAPPDAFDDGHGAAARHHPLHIERHGQRRRRLARTPDDL